MKCERCGSELPAVELFVYCDKCDKEITKEARRLRKEWLDERRAARKMMKAEMDKYGVSLNDYTKGV